MKCKQRLCGTLHLPDAADQNTTAVIAGKSSPLHCDANMPLSTYKLSISLSLCSEDTLPHTLEKTHCFSLYLNSSLHSGRVANERKDVVYFVTEIAETSPEEEQLWSKQG